MKFRPQVQLRFRGADQYEEVKRRAAAVGRSLNEYVLTAVEKSLGGGDGRKDEAGSEVFAGAMGRKRKAGGGMAGKDSSRAQRAVGAESRNAEVAGGTGKRKAGKELTAEQFFALPRSEQDQARREGKY